MTNLNGARLGIPEADREDTKAIGLGIIPLIIRGYRSLDTQVKQRRQMY